MQERRNESDDANINGDEKQYEERGREYRLVVYEKKEKERSNHLLFYLNIRWIHDGNLLVYLTHR